MKKIFIVVLALVLCLCMSTVCLASGEVEAEENIHSTQEEVSVKTYITDKIVPVAVAVLTSILAFLGTLGTVARSLKSLKDTKEAFSDEAKERTLFFESGIELLDEKAEELKEAAQDMPALRARVEELTEKCELLAEILSLGFSANSEIVRSGKGKKMALLLESAKGKMQQAELRGVGDCRGVEDAATYGNPKEVTV